MKLIDLDALMKYPIRLDHCDKEHGDINFVYGIESVLEYAEYLPIIDAVPVIRCKDCKYWDGRYCHNKHWGDGYGNYTPPIKNENGFCDWAEREEK